MDHESDLRRNNKIKLIGSLSAVFAVLLMGDTADLVNVGPGVLSGICIGVTVVCMVLISTRAK